MHTIMKLLQQHSLRAYNTFGLDYQARLFVEVTSVNELRTILQREDLKDLPRLILGGGSNVLLTKDFDGIVIHMAMKGITLSHEDKEHYYVTAQAGEVWHAFVLQCIENNWAGLENLSLIPGCVGASPMQNIGAYGVEIKDRFHALTALNIATGELETFDLDACEFGYRESVFKRKLKGQYIICSVTYKLLKSPQLNTSYGAIELELNKMEITEPTIKDVSNAVISIRQSKLPDPKEIGNSGSFFKNPVISNETFKEILEKHPDIAHYPAGDQQTKVAAGWLIDRAGWKGKTIENYGVHTKQALVLVNYGGASGKAIYDLSEDIIQSVKETYGITLEREVNVL